MTELPSFLFLQDGEAATLVEMRWASSSTFRAGCFHFIPCLRHCAAMHLVYQTFGCRVSHSHVNGLERHEGSRIVLFRVAHFFWVSSVHSTWYQSCCFVVDYSVNSSSQKMKRFERIIPVYLESMKIPLSAIVYMVYSAIVRRLAFCN